MLVAPGAVRRPDAHSKGLALIKRNINPQNPTGDGRTVNRPPRGTTEEFSGLPAAGG